MKSLNRILVVVIAIVGGVLSASAQSRNSYFMEGSYFRTDMNPALVPTRGFVSITPLGGVGLSLNNNFISVDNFLYQRDGEMVTFLNGKVSSEEFMKKLPKNCNLGADVRMNFVNVGFYTGHMFWNFGANMRANVNVSLPSSLFGLVKNLSNDTFDLGNLGISASAYMETYLGTSIPIGEHVNLGVRLKYLTGLFNANINLNNSYLSIDEDQIYGKLSGTGVIASPLLATKGVVMEAQDVLDNLADNINPAFNMSDGFNVMNMMKQFSSWGLAADLGVEVRLLDNHLRISAAVTDLGIMRYSANQALMFNGLSGSGYFNGISFSAKNGNEESGESVEGSESEDLGFEFTGGEVKGADKAYTKMLNCTLNAGVEYNILRNHIAFGLLSHTEFVNKMAFSELTASVNFRPTNWLSATFSHTFLNKHALGVLGFALNLHPRVINLFVGMDFIDTRFSALKVNDGASVIPVPRYMKSANVYFGFGWNFARPKWMRNKKAKTVEEAQPMGAAPVVAMMR